MFLLIVEWGAGRYNISGPEQSMKIDDRKISRSIDDNRLINYCQPIDDQSITWVVVNFIDCHWLALNSCLRIFRYRGSVRRLYIIFNLCSKVWELFIDVAPSCYINWSISIDYRLILIIHDNHKNFRDRLSIDYQYQSINWYRLFRSWIRIFGGWRAKYYTIPIIQCVFYTTQC